ncbi:MAG: hypothetical protein EPO11_09835 [Gammaproteobacteria bacterium]|nr:MAG: hypothetical protein EPO11_09835 [Gammaproteobacteria bacterium]
MVRIINFLDENFEDGTYRRLVWEKVGNTYQSNTVSASISRMGQPLDRTFYQRQSERINTLLHGTGIVCSAAADSISLAPADRVDELLSDSYDSEEVLDDFLQQQGKRGYSFISDSDTNTNNNNNQPLHENKRQKSCVKSQQNLSLFKQIKYPRTKVTYESQQVGNLTYSVPVYTPVGNEVYEIKKWRKPQDDWYGKKTKDAISALRETIGQEILRLMIPYQPKTRRVEGKSINVMAKKVEGFVSLSDLLTEKKINIKEKIKQGEYKGLGKLLVLALFLHEVDLHLKNIGINKYNQIVNIDGDWKFVDSQDNYPIEKTAITAQLFQFLPFIKTNYTLYNWLDVIAQGKQRASQIIDEEIMNLPDFRQEVNEALLLIILMPSELWETFINSYMKENETQEIHDEAKRLLKILKSQQTYFAAAALDLPDFKEYVASQVADEDVTKYLSYLSQFRTTNNINLMERYSAHNFHSNVEEEMSYKLVELKFGLTPSLKF